MGLSGFTREEMTEVNRVMVEDFRIPIELMMELAGHNLANIGLNLSRNNDSNYIIIVGSGNNAGRALLFFNNGVSGCKE